jgi:hypothetical protein
MSEVATRPGNPFGEATIAARPSGNAVAQSDQQRSIAEVQAAMMIARMNPRDPVAAMDRILNACTRPTLADAAVYQYSRGGSDVSGPSIRLAEAMAQQWGNIKTSVRELDQANGASTVQTVAWDLETGYQCDKVFQVPHLRHTKRGVTRLEDPRDIYELIANQGARRLRSCILAVIPGDVTEAAVAQCEATMKAKADTSPEAMLKMVDAFAAYGVTREQIEKRIQRRLDAIQPAQVVSLKKVYASMRDGMSAAADWFDPIEPPPGSEGAPASATEKLKAAVKQRSTKNAAPAAREAVDAATGDIRGTPAFDLVAGLKRIEACTDMAALQLIGDDVQEMPDTPERDAMLAALLERDKALAEAGK